MGFGVALGILCVLSILIAVALTLVISQKQKQKQQDTDAGGDQKRDEDQAAVKYDTGGSVPSDWKKVSVSITGKLLDTLDCGTVSLADAMQKCHKNTECTHVEAWPKQRRYYLKNANTIPSDCAQGKQKCSDGDWKDGGGWGWYHPKRDWGGKAENIERVIKELECSSGSQCAKSKIWSWVDIGLTLLFYPISSIEPLVSSFPQAVSWAARAAATAELTSAVGTTAGQILDQIVASKKEAKFPYFNSPYISPTDYAIGAKRGQYLMYYKQHVAKCQTRNSRTVPTHLCSFSNVNALERKMDARTEKVYKPWKALYAKWDTLPIAGGGNYNDINWLATYDAADPFYSNQNTWQDLDELDKVDGSSSARRVRKTSKRRPVKKTKASSAKRARPTAAKTNQKRAKAKKPKKRR